MLETIALVALGLLGMALYGFSLLDGRATRRSLATGRASLDLLSDYLGHSNVAKIEATLGAPDECWHYNTTSWKRLRRSWAVRIFDTPASDVVGLPLALAGIVLKSWTLVAAPFAWFGLCLVVVAYSQRLILHRDGELSECLLVPIGSSLESAQLAWGSCQEQAPDEENPSEARVFVFDVSPSVGAQVTLFHGAIHRITYATSNKNPTRDLACIFMAYGSKGDWSEMTPGYSYRRKDGEVLVWCSAMPWTTVVSETFWKHTCKRRKDARSQSAT